MRVDVKGKIVVEHERESYKIMSLIKVPVAGLFLYFASPFR